MAQPLSSQDVQDALDAYFGPQESLSFVSIEEETKSIVDMASPLNKITALSFVSKELQTFPSNELYNLRELEFLACHIPQPLNLSTLTALRVLKLAETNNVLVHTAPNLTHLQMKNSRHFLKNQKDGIVLPESVTDVTLQIGDNFYVESLAHCTGLTALSLIRAYYGIADITLLPIPATIFNNSSLTKLDLCWHGLTEIPEGVYTNTNLVSLVISRTDFPTIPTTLSQATSLTNLSICPYSHSPYLPLIYLEDITAIWQLTNLQSLCLSAVKNEVTVPLESLPHLEKLDIEEAQIGWISSFPYLKSLKVSFKNTPIATLIEKINQLQHLTHLKICLKSSYKEIDLNDFIRLHHFEHLELTNLKVEDLSALYPSQELRIFESILGHKNGDEDTLKSIIQRNRQRHMQLQKLALSSDIKD